jgi:hypothetical protein
MSMVGALSNYTASLSSNTTLLRDGQTLSVAVPSGLSVSAGNILGLSRKSLKKGKKRKMNQISSASVFLEKKAKRPPLSASVLLTKRPVHINPRGGNCSSDSDDEDGVMELLGESRTRKPSTTFSTTPAATSTAASATANGNAPATTTSSTTAAAVTATTAAAAAPSSTSTSSSTSSSATSATISSSTSAPASSSA